MLKSILRTALAAALLSACFAAGAQPTGRAHPLGRIAGLADAREVRVETQPPTPQPLSFFWDNLAGEGSLVIPTITPAGEYQARIVWRDAAGRERQHSLQLNVQAPPPLRTGSQPPVILLNGFQSPDNLLEILLYGACPVSRTEPPSRATFGELENVLTAAGHPVLFFDNCVECRGGTIEECGQALGRYLAEYPTENGEGLPQADLVGHSMGGLIARAYLAGMLPDGSFHPPAPLRVRKLALLGTPNFGSFRALNLPFLSPQLPEMMPGSDFLFRLATWDGGGDGLRGVDALSLAGNGCFFGNLAEAGDGVVSLISASLNFAREPERTRILPYRHTDGLGSLCPDRTPLASVDGPAHLTAAALLSFLDDTGEWRNIGMSAADEFYLLRYGAGLAALPGATRLISGAGVEWTKGPEPNPSNIFHAPFLPSEATDLWFEIDGMWVRFDAVIPVGTALAATITP